MLKHLILLGYRKNFQKVIFFCVKSAYTHYTHYNRFNLSPDINVFLVSEFQGFRVIEIDIRMANLIEFQWV